MDVSTSRDRRVRSVDELIELAANDPEALERYRQQQIEEILLRAPAYLQQRLRGLQFKIDAQRQIHKTPMGACIQISNMMHDSFTEMQELLQELSTKGGAAITSPLVQAGQSGTRTKRDASAKVIPFQRNRANPA